MDKQDLNRRFISYMANLIYYNSINFDKRRRLKDKRFPLTFDSSEQFDSELPSVLDSVPLSPNLKDHISDPILFQAFDTLSVQQQQILSLAFVQSLNDKEISKILGGSQQNISKHRLKALSKLRNHIRKGE